MEVIPTTPLLTIHPNTARNQIRILEKKGYIKCTPEGKRLYCKRIKPIKI